MRYPFDMTSKERDARRALERDGYKDDGTGHYDSEKFPHHGFYVDEEGLHSDM